jgi:hypothetical protein
LIESSNLLSLSQHGHSSTVPNQCDQREEDFDDDECQADAREENFHALRVRLQDDEEDEADGTEQSVENEHDHQHRFQHQVSFDTEEVSKEIVEAEHEDDGDFHAEGIAGVREMMVFEDETENFENKPKRRVEKIGMQK